MLIIGYGNPLRGDDGFGYRAAERIPGALAVHQLTPELMETVSRVDRVVFIDATAEGVPGEIRRQAVVPSAPDVAFTHFATPAALLSGARALFGRVPEATLITVCGRCFELSEALTAEVQHALETVVAEFVDGR